MMEQYIATIQYKDGKEEQIMITAESLDDADFIVGGIVAFNPNFKDYTLDLMGDDI